MDKIKNPFYIVRKPPIKDEVKFAFRNDHTNKVMFQSLMRDDIDFSSINLNSLERHFDYSYDFSIKDTGKWVKKGKTKLIIPEFIDSGTGLEYSFIEYSSSDKLIVVFSSSTNVNNTYNYFRTLKGVPCNKLFIADENIAGDELYSSYFIGRNKDNTYEKKVIQIINKISKKLNINKDNIILSGSSKGGFASLYYLFKYRFGKCIVGSPTINLGQQHMDNTSGLRIIENLSGGRTTQDIQWVDNLILKHIKNDDFHPEIYYHAGNLESRYLNQGQAFFNRLKELDKSVKCVDLGNYKSHKEVINYYPQFLVENIIKIDKNLGKNR